QQIELSGLHEQFPRERPIFRVDLFGARQDFFRHKLFGDAGEHLLLLADVFAGEDFAGFAVLEEEAPAFDDLGIHCDLVLSAKKKRVWKERNKRNTRKGQCRAEIFRYSAARVSERSRVGTTTCLCAMSSIATVVLTRGGQLLASAPSSVRTTN